jgi:alkanesulfonate monooxygenase SsuD/methylene tetrahydromethanopterin reductase-like flavin-dependent oxidoreductase (luciferase family)
MLPNHNPFVIAEQFGTLDALFPGRVDLGLGRAPGAAPILGQALRKDLHRAAEYFPQDVVELRALLTGDLDLPIAATPGLGAQVRDVDARLQPVRRAAGRAAGHALCLCQPFRARPPRRRAGTYREQFRPLPTSTTACDGGDDGDLRR